jgi:hypothetical protein
MHEMQEKLVGNCGGEARQDGRGRGKIDGKSKASGK